MVQEAAKTKETLPKSRLQAPKKTITFGKENTITIDFNQDVDFGRAFESWILERNDEKLMDTLFTNQSLIQTDHVAAREDITLVTTEKEFSGMVRLDTLELDATDLLASFDADMFYQMEHIEKSQQKEQEQQELENANLQKRKRKKGLLRKMGFGKEDIEGKSLSPSQSERSERSDKELTALPDAAPNNQAFNIDDV